MPKGLRMYKMSVTLRPEMKAIPTVRQEKLSMGYGRERNIGIKIKQGERNNEEPQNKEQGMSNDEVELGISGLGWRDFWDYGQFFRLKEEMFNDQYSMLNVQGRKGK
jgi:hypothetical protein